ncbi:chemotaxis protein CheW [Maridesulfovibrio zosterae]|uniref:chemotaxis protein CheW n=1 Tax=Maridesulfovibrio zosterae TaxID=82171 RepID=UPI0004059108|nr:chemotaxis protein CheW [Maridesulfovibrio zosterae]
MGNSKVSEFIGRENDRELLRKRAVKLALNVDDDLSEHTESNSRDYVIFSMGGNIYAIETVFIKEVLEPDEIVSVPCTPEFLKGVVSVRGNIWAVVDLCVFFGTGKPVDPQSSKVLLLSSGEKEFGIVLDEVIDVIPISNVENKPLTQSNNSVYLYSRGVTEDLKIILNGELLLTEKAFVINESVGNI